MTENDPPPYASKSEASPAMPDDARIAAGMKELNGLLVPGERLLAYAVQRRLFALSHRRIIVAATTGRIITLSRGLIAGYVPDDVRWQDLRDVSISAGIFDATLSVTAMANEDLAHHAQSSRVMTIVGLRKQEAQRVYTICQGQEQAWREKRRVRDLDELRAESGGFQFGQAGPGGLPVASAGGVSDPAERLRRAKEMLDTGLITDAEYETIKARIVDGL